MAKTNDKSPAQRYAEAYLAYQRGERKRGPNGYDFGLGGDDANLIRMEVEKIMQDRGETLERPSVYVQQNATNQAKRQGHYDEKGLDAGVSISSSGIRKLSADWRAGRTKPPEFSLSDDD